MDQIILSTSDIILLYRSVDHGTDRMKVGYGIVGSLGSPVFRICFVQQDLLDPCACHPVSSHFGIGELQLRNKHV